MLRCLKIHKTKPVNLRNFSGLIHNLIGWEVSLCSSEPDQEEIEQFTTKHSIVTPYATQPIQTQQFRKARYNG